NFNVGLDTARELNWNTVDSKLRDWSIQVNLSTVDFVTLLREHISHFARRYRTEEFVFVASTLWNGDRNSIDLAKKFAGFCLLNCLCFLDFSELVLELLLISHRGEYRHTFGD